MPLEKIISALQNMDIGRLEKLMLAESYDGASKEIYLKKLEALFDELRAEGDTFLEAVPGYCNSGCSFCGNTGVMLVGNHSRNFISIVFGQHEGDHTSFKCCHDFLPDELPETNELKTIRIYTNEFHDFKHHDRYKKLRKDTLAAYDELFHDEERIFSLIEIFEWRRRHRELEFSIDIFSNYPPDMKIVGSLLREIEEIEEKLYLESRVADLMKEFDARRFEKNEHDYLGWLVKGEDLRTYSNLHLFNVYLSKYEQPENSGYFIFCGIKIDSSDCPALIEFYHKHHLVYPKMVEKYHVRPELLEWDKEDKKLKLHEYEYYLREGKIRELIQDPEDVDYVEDIWSEEEWIEYEKNKTKLSYHLRKRGII